MNLCSTGSPTKYVTLDKNSWELIVYQMDAMMGYLQDSSTFYKDFGKPSKIYLPTHDINFTTAYGERKHRQKKRKYENPPGVIMQQATLSELREVRECVDTKLKRLEECAGFINRGIDNIIEFLKVELFEIS